MKFNDILPQGTTININEYSPLTLAFVGDSVYELYVRAHITGEHNAPADKLHKLAVAHVKAKAQSDAIKSILDDLEEDELMVFKRGRNAKSGTVPKNADITDYRYATGFEALIGYLFLTNREDRLLALCQSAMNHSKS